MSMQTTINRLMLVILCLFLIVFTASFSAGHFLSTPAPRAIGAAPAPMSALAEPVSISGHGGTLLSGWFIDTKQPKGAVLLLHGVRSDRREMLSRAKFLSKAGYSVLLYDSRGHGESEGSSITFGYLESKDAELAFNYLQERIPGVPIGIIGMSLGGAAAVLGNSAGHADWLILEAVYPDLISALNNRLKPRLGPFSVLAKMLLLPQIQWRLGVPAQWFSPLKRLRTLETPTLIIAGEHDQRTTLEQSNLLFTAANQPKEFYMVEGAAHENYHAVAKADYEQVVFQFIGKYQND